MSSTNKKPWNPSRRFAVAVEDELHGTIVASNPDSSSGSFAQWLFTKEDAEECYEATVGSGIKAVTMYELVPVFSTKPVAGKKGANPQ